MIDCQGQVTIDNLSTCKGHAPRCRWWPVSPNVFVLTGPLLGPQCRRQTLCISKVNLTKNKLLEVEGARAVVSIWRRQFCHLANSAENTFYPTAAGVNWCCWSTTSSAGACAVWQCHRRSCVGRRSAEPSRGATVDQSHGDVGGATSLFVFGDRLTSGLITR